LLGRVGIFFTPQEDCAPGVGNDLQRDCARRGAEKRFGELAGGVQCDPRSPTARDLGHPQKQRRAEGGAPGCPAGAKARPILLRRLRPG
jgi:hypothetical protein